MSDKRKNDKVYGRNIFTESRDSFIEDDNALQFMSAEKTVSSIAEEDSKKVKKIQAGTSIKSSSGSQMITALYITDKFVSLVQTYYDKLVYTINKADFENIKKPEITEENMLKGISKEDKIAAVIDTIEVLLERNGIDKKNTRFVTGLTGKNIVKQLKINGKSELEIPLELPRLLLSPFEPSLSQYVYEVLNTKVNEEDIQEFDVLACVFNNSDFFELQGILAASGIESNIMDIDTIALVNLYLESINPEPDKLNCIIDIGEENSSIIIHANNENGLYIRTLDFTYNSFRKILAKNRDFSEAEAEEMIQNRNFYDYLTKTFEQETTENLNNHYSVKNYIKRELISELSRTFQFYSRQNNNKYPAQIYVTGLGSRMKNFVSFLVSNLDIKCAELDITGFLMGNEVLLKKISENTVQYYKTLGLALRYE